MYGTIVRIALVGVVLAAPARAQNVVFTGRVTDAGTRQPVAGANVAAPSTGMAVTTGADGRYVVRVRAAEARGRDVTFMVRRIGYVTLGRTVRVGARADTVRVDFALTAAATTLTEQRATADSTSGRVAASSRVAAAGAMKSGRGVVLQGAPSMAGTPFITHSTGVAGGAARGRAAANAGVPRRAAPGMDPGADREGYDRIVDNPFLAVRANPQSTFAADVDRASYGNVRRFLDGGTLPPKDAVRIEELVNYFPYALPSPRGDEPFSVTTEVAPAPWSPTHRLVRIGLQTARIEARDLPPSNLVFLIDVSGSMQPANKLPLLKRSFAMLVDQLREQDRVAIVVYAGSAGLVLESTRGSDKPRILEAIERLEAGGSTAGGEGLRLAYEVARRHHVNGGVNRVILATDGDFNVGESSDAAMERLVEEKRKQGTFLTVLGFGTGNYQDAKMEKLADRGNGNYAYVDDVLEARKALVHEMGATLHTVAKDVKLQVEFNPARVAAYRLIGYENRLLRAEDFADDTKDAGEMGAGHAVTALYEIVPVGARTTAVIRGADSLRYQRPTERTGAASGPELAFVKLRYKAPDGDRSRLMEHAIIDRGVAPSVDFTFAAAVASFGMVLRESEHRGSATLDDVIAMATRARGEDPNGYRAEFIELARKARAIKAGNVAER